MNIIILFIFAVYKDEVQPSYMNPTKYKHIQVVLAENYKNSFFPRTVRLWNASPAFCHSAKSIAVLNSQCQAWLARTTGSTVSSATSGRKNIYLRYGDFIQSVKFIRVLLIFYDTGSAARQVQYGYSLSETMNED